MESASSSSSQVQRAALMSILAALLLVVLKFVAGLASGSLGLVAEALHSATDLVAAMLTWIAVRVGQRPPDRRHPWGHGRAEHLAALAEAVLLLGATGYIAWEAIRRITTRSDHETVATWWTFATIGLVIVIDLWRIWSSITTARRHGSPALASNAVHFASDFVGSLAVLGGLVLVEAGIPVGDSAAALIVAAIVAIAAWRLLWDNAQVLMDVVPAEAEAEARTAIEQLDLPLELRRLRIRRSAGHHLADVVIGVSATDHVAQGHAIADAVERAVVDALPGSDVVVHVEPAAQHATTRDRATAAALSLPGIHEVHNVTVLLVRGRPEISMHLKVAAGMSLREAHELADLVEEHVAMAVPDVVPLDVHIEPMESGTLTTAPVVDTELTRIVERAVADVTGSPPAALRLRHARSGLTAFLTILADPDCSLLEAHALASRVEQAVCQQVSSIAEAVVHTEPADEWSADVPERLSREPDG